MEHVNPFTLLVAVVLSAQATDAGVNKATRALFAKADPAMALHGEDDDYLEAPAANLDGFLRERDGLYPKDVHVSEPGFNAFLAGVRADMPAHRVDVYMLLAERAMKQNHAGMARIYEGKAKAAAKAAGLPEPAPLVASR